MVTCDFDINNLFDSQTNIYISVRSIDEINQDIVKVILKSGIPNYCFKIQSR